MHALGTIRTKQYHLFFGWRLLALDLIDRVSMRRAESLSNYLDLMVPMHAIILNELEIMVIAKPYSKPWH